MLIFHYRIRESKPLKKLILLDRFLFDTAMSDPEIRRNILSIIFGEKEVPPDLVEFLHYVENPECGDVL